MTKTEKMDDAAAPGLVERIANELPSDARAAYYQEMLYCKTLRNDDEMLRILRVMQLLTLIMVEIPGKIAAERKEYETIFMVMLHKLKEHQRANRDYMDKLENHLAGLPKKIKEDVNPAAIVSQINESLKQEFLRSTIPQTGEALRLVGQQMKASVDDFVDTSKALTHSYFGIAERAKTAIESMDGAITSAARAAKTAAQDLSDTFLMKYYWAVFAITGLALVLGFIGGTLMPFSK